MTSRTEDVFVLLSSTSHRRGPSSLRCRVSPNGLPRIRRKTQPPNISIQAAAFGGALRNRARHCRLNVGTTGIKDRLHQEHSELERNTIMGLSWQQGPLSGVSVGRFLTPEPLPKRLLFAEP